LSYSFAANSRVARVLGAIAIGVAAAATPAIANAQLIRSATGSAVDILATVNLFRSDIGGGFIAGANGSFGGVRREINWDGVPDAFAAPNTLPADFFNVNSPRGVVFSTPGTGFQVSADAVNPTATPVEFGNIDASHPAFFATFTPERLFTALGSTITDVSFFLPGTATASTTTAFGVVFTDVDQAGSTSLQFFDALSNSLGIFFAPALNANETFSFLGVSLAPGQVASRVRITSGNQVLALGNTANDLVVMDDFIYAEPGFGAQVVPEPSTWMLLAFGLVAVGALARRRVV
jgi:hypothetical protein